MIRQLYVAAAIAVIGISAATQSQAEEQQPVIRAHGNPYLIDFYLLSGKRRDLHSAAIRKGLDTAFTQWLRVERNHIYLRYVKAETFKRKGE